MSVLYEQGTCEVCWHELAEPVPEAESEPVFLHAAFYSVRCKEWALCADHLALAVGGWRMPYQYCECPSN